LLSFPFLRHFPFVRGLPFFQGLHQFSQNFFILFSSIRRPFRCDLFLLAQRYGSCFFSFDFFLTPSDSASCLPLVGSQVLDMIHRPSASSLFNSSQRLPCFVVTPIAAALCNPAMCWISPWSCVLEQWRLFVLAPAN